MHAEWYECVSDGKDKIQEIDFWAKSIQAHGQPALELGSGTGRMYIPLLEKGFDITGIDTSDDMMDRCRARCQTRGLKPQLYNQSMLELRLPRQFSLAFLPSGSLGLFIADDDIRRMFERVMAHLKPGGVFIYEYQPVSDAIEKAGGSSNWIGDWVRGPDGVILAWRNRWRRDPVAHTWECLFVVEKYVEGRLVETEANERTGRYFTAAEALEYASVAGFEDIRATKWLTDEPPDADTQVITVRCRKPL